MLYLPPTILINIGWFFMRKFLVVFLISIMLAGCSLLSKDVDEQFFLTAEKISFDSPVSFEEIANKVGSAVVGISGEMVDGTSIGSGVCGSNNGYILTNSHCITDSKSIVIYMVNGKTATAKIVYDNPVADLAIIKTNAAIPYLEIGSSDGLSVGQDVLAIGTPLSLSLTHSFTKGIVSAINRTLKVGSSLGEGFMQNLIQHDASLNPGNSGGPLINNKGEVVGINTLKISGGEGIGFAIPSKTFESLVESYVEDSNYSLPRLGVFGLDSSIANYYNVSSLDSGFFVLSVANDSPLGDCGVLPYSIITKFNGRQIVNTLDLQDELYKLSATDTVLVEFVYDGEVYRVKTKLK